MRLRSALILTSSVLAFVAASCVVGPVDYANKRCDIDEDCPADMVCAELAPGEPKGCVFTPQGQPPGGGGPDGGAGGPDGGTGPGAGGDGGQPGDGGVTVPGGDGGTPTGPFYCTEVKPILDTYCAGCHTSPPSGGAPATFRLDVYETTNVPGAFARAARIKARAVDTMTMPPSSAPRPSADERATLAAWVNAGAPECADKPVEPTDGGMPPGNSVGYTGGPVSYAQHIQPLWDTYCITCHGGADPEGDMDLSGPDSWSVLMQESHEDNDYRRVQPGDPASSLLWIAISGGQADLIPPMPDGTPGLKTIAPEDFEVIELWIQQGAPNN